MPVFCRQMRWSVSILLLIVGLSQHKARAACTASAISRAQFKPSGTAFSTVSSSDATLCKTSCENDPRCMAYTLDTASGDCSLHSSKTAYNKLVDSGTSTVQHTYLQCDAADYWTYYGWNQGCGSTYAANMKAANGVAVTASTRWSCWYQCLQYPRCGGWDWDPSGADNNNKCFLSKLGDTLASGSGVESHTVICPTNPYKLLASGWDYYPMFFVPGGKLQAAGYASLVSCQTACEADSTCVALDWDVDKKRCWFHSSTGTDTSCKNFPIGSRNTYHMKKTASALFCTETDKPVAPLTTA